MDLLVQIRKNKWKCSTSSFSILEILDAQQEERWISNKHLQGLTLSQVLHKLHERHSNSGLSERQLITVYEETHDSLSQIEDCIEFLYPHETLWDDAERLLRVTNIGAVDAIHLATAMAVKCDLIVTRDSKFRAMAKVYIQSVEPDKVMKEITKMQQKEVSDVQQR